jgi:hypothetical protein
VRVSYKLLELSEMENVNCLAESSVDIAKSTLGGMGWERSGKTSQRWWL